MRIELGAKATAHVLEMTTPLNRSAADIVNLVMESVEVVEITQVIKMKVKTDPELVKDGAPKYRIVRKTSSWKVTM